MEVGGGGVAKNVELFSFFFFLEFLSFFLASSASFFFFFFLTDFFVCWVFLFFGFGLFSFPSSPSTPAPPSSMCFVVAFCVCFLSLFSFVLSSFCLCLM